MRYKKIVPHPDLRPYIECFYVWDHQGSPLSKLIVQTPPSGFAALVFNFGDPYNVNSINGQFEQVPAIFLTGQATKNYYIEIAGRLEIFGVVCKPAALSSLFQIPMHEVTDRRIDARLILGKQIQIVFEQLAGKDEDAGRTQIMNSFLLQALEQKNPIWDEVDHAVEIISTQQGILSLKQLYGQYSISTRQFQRNFHKKVGLSPKGYTRLRKFSHICHMLVTSKHIDWHEIVHYGGYYDQSHFIKDFLAYMDENPSLYYGEQRELIHLLD